MTKATDGDRIKTREKCSECRYYSPLETVDYSGTITRGIPVCYACVVSPGNAVLISGTDPQHEFCEMWEGV